MEKILLVEDEVRLQEIIVDYFEAKGAYEIITAKDGIEALSYFEEYNFCLVLLDVMMPKLDGFSVCKAIRKKYAVPIIFLTAKSREEDQMYGYALGADDYITKPFSLGILYAKVTALLKRTKGQVIDEKIRSLEVVIDTKRMLVTVAGKVVELAPMEYKLLVYLVVHRNQIITREQIIVKLWGYDFEGNERSLDTHIKKLRKALGKCGKSIVTVRKVGYKWEEKR